MSLTRHLGRDGIAHAHADSITHARHVKARSRRKKIEWIPQPAEESTAAEFRLQDTTLIPQQGRYFIQTESAEQCVDGTMFETHLRIINQRRSWNYSMMKRGASSHRTKRKRSSPACEEFVVNLAPHQMRFLNEELKLWKSAGMTESDRKKLFEDWVDDLRSTVVAEFQAASSRDVVASYTHYDSNKIHFGVVHSRVSADNTLVGEKRLGTVGPWTVAQNRLRKLGMTDDADTRLDDNLNLFQRRYPRKTPLDIRLHDALDLRFDELVDHAGSGAKSRFESAADHYRRWKEHRTKVSLYRSPMSQSVAWQTLRFVSPLLPKPVRIALSVARTLIQAFGIIQNALNNQSGSGDGTGSSISHQLPVHPSPK